MNAVEIKNLTKTYKGFKLDNVNLTLPSGCILGLIGENGAGKSTTIKLILDIIHKDSGSVFIYGKDHTAKLQSIKEDLGVVLDDNGIPAVLNAKKIDRVMKYAYPKWSTERFYQLLEQMDVPKDKCYGDMSKGNKMKMGISIALAHDPKLLILDEATNGLDPVAKEEVLNLLFEFTRDEEHTIIISSHIVSDLEKLCDYIAFIHKGKVMLMEEKDQLFESYGTVHVTKEQFEKIPANAVVGKKISPYGVEVLLKRHEIPGHMQLAISPINIEELFVYMVKGE